MARSVLALGESVAAEATCPVCLELLSRPVLTECGHSFCGRCLEAVLAGPGSGSSGRSQRSQCPQCRADLRPGSLRPNRALGAVAELAAQLETEARRPRCPEHDEPLTLFCESCRRLLCPLCPDQDRHRHRARPAVDTARQLRETLQNDLDFLQKEKKEFQPEGEKQCDDLLAEVALERQKLQGTFEQLGRFLRQQEELLLAQLDRTHGELVEQRRGYLSHVAEKKRLLDTLVEEIEKKRDQPVAEFLMDVDRTLGRCQEAKAPLPEPVSPELQRDVGSLCETSRLLVEEVAEFQVNLLRKMDRERVEVTLDPRTASPDLLLSEDLRSLRLADGQQDLPDTPSRFTGSPSVLGSRGFSSGRHYWELEVGAGDSWAAGVALESVPRKDSLSRAMGKVWALRRDWHGGYTALHMAPAPLELQEQPRRVRIHLDCDVGTVTFYNTDNKEQLLQFKASFSERVFPFFWLWSEGATIQLCS